MKVKVTGLLIAVALYAGGCASNLISKALDNGQALSPEQVEAYNKVGLDTYSCIVVTGPPPSGALVVITLPKSASHRAFQFGTNCQILSH